MSRSELLAVARGDHPAELVLTRGRVVDVFGGELLEADVAVHAGQVAGVGRYRGREVVDLEGAYLAPGFIDAHVHVESSLVPPAELGRTLLPLGTTTVITDPHEIANVLGLEGVRFMLRDAERSPLEIFVMAPSCVPATEMETSGARLTAEDLREIAGHPRVLGLAEVMNFPGVVHGDAGVQAKLDAFAGRVVDGHCPQLSGRELAAYAAAGIGSDHECTSVEEAREKLQCGLTVFIREATNARNLEALLPLVTPANQHRVCFCTDDRQPADLLDQGHLDFMVRTAIARGLEPMTALRIASWNAADYFRLRDRGAIAPGRRADLVAFRDLAAPRPHMVWSEGRLVAREGRTVDPAPEASREDLPPSMHVDWDRVDLGVRASGSELRVIGVVPDQLVTQHLRAAPRVDDGWVQADPQRDLLKIAVIERHRATGAVGVGFVRGFGLRRGALASSVAHDHHNLVVVGADDRSMMTAARRCAGLGGGLVVAEGEAVRAELPLPLAGLMSPDPIQEVRRRLDRALAEAAGLGAALRDPFMAMSFLALEVIPSLKITDQGLIDVERFEPVALWAS